MNSEMLQYFKANNLTLEEFKIATSDGNGIWHTVILKDGLPFSGGFNLSKDISRKISYSEYLERKSFFEISKNEFSRKTWALDKVKTACGFAAGFDKDSTIMRSLEESIERWTVSQWIDQKKHITKVNVSNLLDESTQWFLNFFESVDFFQQEVPVYVDDRLLKFHVSIAICIKDDGVFPGYACRSSSVNGWQHTLVEAFRNYRVSKTVCASNNGFPFDRINFFAKNSRVALSQIAEAKCDKWTMPSLEFHHVEHFAKENFFLSRCLMKNWKFWNEGPIDRFVF